MSRGRDGLTTRTRNILAKYRAGIPINGNARKALRDKGLIESGKKPRPVCELALAWVGVAQYDEPEGV